MNQTFKAADIDIGFHPDGYRIDKTASPMNFYTQWQISDDGHWYSPKPVDFGVFPENGWVKSEGFDWDRDEKSEL